MLAAVLAAVASQAALVVDGRVVPLEVVLSCERVGAVGTGKPRAVGHVGHVVGLHVAATGKTAATAGEPADVCAWGAGRTIGGGRRDGRRAWRHRLLAGCVAEIVAVFVLVLLLDRRGSS